MSAGLLESLRAMAGTLGEIVHVRGALFAVELREEIASRKEMLVLVVVGGVLLHMALIMLTFLVVVVFWDSYRVGAIAAMTALYLACGAAAFIRLRAKAAASAPFAATLGELERDLEQLRGSR